MIAVPKSQVKRTVRHYYECDEVVQFWCGLCGQMECSCGAKCTLGK